jgi:retron-type reverse transcriptase
LNETIEAYTRRHIQRTQQGVAARQLAITPKDAASGVDRVSAAEYEANLAEDIKQLVERLKRKSYRAKLVRLHYIPKGNGGLRPLGIPATEDKLLQLN